MRLYVPGFILLLAVALIGGCGFLGSDDEGPPARPVQGRVTFDSGLEGWRGGFADYSVEQDDSLMNRRFEWRVLPRDVDSTGHALFLSGRNTSDDLFMFAKTQVTGLAPNTAYDVSMRVFVASNAPSDCVGIGGPPGEAVYMKVGASRAEPRPIIRDGMYRMNVDKGNQSQGGEQAHVIGHIANGLNECHDTPYRMITRETEEPVRVETAGSGTLWIFVGTDSGFEGTTSLYYDTIDVAVRPADSESGGGS